MSGISRSPSSDDMSTSMISVGTAARTARAGGGSGAETNAAAAAAAAAFSSVSISDPARQATTGTGRVLAAVSGFQTQTRPPRIGIATSEDETSLPARPGLGEANGRTCAKVANHAGRRGRSSGSEGKSGRSQSGDW
jgi:hypothetical protein